MIADEDCLSLDPANCLVYCLVKKPRSMIQIEVADNFCNLDFQELNREYLTLLSESNYIQYCEIDCKISESSIGDSETVLNNCFKNQMGSINFDRKLRLFQHHLVLPIGGFDDKTWKSWMTFNQIISNKKSSRDFAHFFLVFLARKWTSLVCVFF